MAKQLNVNLAFNADTSKVKSQLDDLQKQLTKVMETATKKADAFGMTKELQEATQAAASLKAHLDQATNVKTGKLDLGLLNQSFKDAGVSLDDYRVKLQKLGPSGEQAFSTLANSILKAEVPLKQSNTMLKEFATTLKNAARWQISSSIIHGFMGSLQHAYGYAQDLNESLNNIRIVTGQSVGQMTEFASEANKAAKALSTTTTDYTNASLIYYQQGLSGEEVKERTDTTIKMANVARESAETVADQMTAVWNNFYDGSKSLEYYADAMTALGAATSSSTDEIATGLNQFAAIADTVGLSYEYAASALATVTATTRQSADVVGTAYKTLFARIQGLNLGETLDDGTDLNKYSQALEAVGISIKDQNGELKDMDSILDEMGSKWGTLAKDQQVALAQTVAGVRQYSQLVALMDNWDFFQKNLNTVNNSEGTLQRQADTYEESWEAAINRVKAASEELYAQLLNDDFFIKMNDGLAGFLGGLSEAIKGIGGVEGAISMLGNVISRVYKKDIADGIDKFIYNLQDSQKVAENMREQAMNSIARMTQDSNLGTVYKDLAGPQEAYLRNAENMSEIERRTAEYMLSQHEARVQELADLAKRNQEAEKAAEEEKDRVDTQLMLNKATKKQRENVNGAIEAYEETNKIADKLRNTLDEAFEALKKEDGSGLNEISEAFQKIDTSSGEFSDDIKQAFDTLKSGNANIDQVTEALRTLDGALNTVGEAGGLDEQAFKRLQTTLTEAGLKEEVVADIMNHLTSSIDNATDSAYKFAETERKVGAESDQIEDAFDKIKTKAMTTGEYVTTLAQTLSALTMSINTIKGLADIWTEKDANLGEQILGTLTALGTVIPMVVMSYRALHAAQIKVNASGVIANLVNKGFIGSLFGVSLGAKDATGSMVALNLSTKSFIVTSLALVGAVAAISLAIGGVVKAIQWAKANSPEGRLKAAKENAKQLHEGLNEAKQAATDLTSAFNDYDNVVTKLNECTKGTQEWKSALTDVNNTVLELLHTYPQLAQYVTRTDDGQLQISDKGRQAMQSEADKAVTIAQGAAAIGDQEVRNKEIKVQRENLIKNISTSAKGNTLNVSSVQDVLAREAIKGVLPELAGKTDAEMKEVLSNAFEKYGVTNSHVIDDWEKAVIKASDDINDLSAAIDENTLATKTENQAIVDNVLSNNDTIQKSDYAKDVMSAGENMYDPLKIQAYIALTNSGWGTEGINKRTGVNNEAKRIFAEYAEAAHITGATLTDTAGMDSNRTFVYEDADGEKHTVSLENMRKVKAVADAEEALGKSAEKLNATFVELGQSGQAYDQAIIDMIAHGNLEDSTKGEVDALKGAIDEAGGTSAYLNGKFGGDDNTLSDEEAQALGYESATKMVDAFSQGISDYDSAVNDLGSDWLESVKTAFGKINTDELSLAQQKALGDSLNKAMANGGEEAMSALNKVFAKAADSEQLGALAKNLDKVDWNSIDESGLIDTLEDAGIKTEDLDIDFKELINSMSTAGDKAESLTKTYASIHKIIDGLKQGDTISAEDYKALGDSAKGYFTQLLDGTYKLTGDAKKFYETVQNGLIEDAKANIDNLRSQTDDMKEVSGYDYDRLTKVANSRNDYNEIEYDFDTINQQVELIKALSPASDELNEKIAGWQEQINKGSFDNIETLQEIADNVSALSSEYDNLSGAISNNEAAILQQELAIASSYDSYKDLKKAYEDGTISVEAFNTAATNLDAVEDIKDLDTEELSNFADYLQEISDSAEDLADGMSEDAAKIVAKGIMKMNDGIDDLASNWENWSGILQESSKSSEEYAKAMDDTRGAMANLLDVSKDFIDDDFVKEHLEDITLAADGDGEAIDRLKSALTDSIVARIEVDNQLNGGELLADVQNLQAELDELGPLEPGFEIDDSDFLKACNDMIAATGMTTDQINALFDSMGFEANFASEGQDVSATQTVYTKKHTVSEEQTNDKTGAKSWTEKEEIVDAQEVPIPATAQAMAFSTNGKVPKINKLTKKATGSSNNYSSSNAGGKSSGKSSGGSGSGGSPKTPDKKDPIKDQADRYYDVNNAISKVNQQLERNEQIQQRLDSMQEHYAGETLIASLKQENKLLSQKNEALDTQYENYKKLFEIQSQELAELQSQLGGIWNGDELQNYSQLFQENVDRYNAAIATYNAMSAEQQEESGKQMIEDAEEAYKTYSEALKRYQDLYYNEMYETENKLAEVRQQQLENQLAIIENNLQAWETEIQLKLDTTEAERQFNDFLKDIEQDFRKLYKDLTIDSAFDTKNLDTYVDDVETRMKQVQNVMAEINKMEASKNANGEVTLGDNFLFGSISEAQEYLKKLQNELVDAGNNLNQMYQQVWDNYIEGLEQAADHFSNINDEFEHITDGLEYEKELIELIYGDEAYDLMNEYYEAQSKNINEQIQSIRTQAAFWEDQFNKAYQMNKDAHNVDLNDMSTWTEDMQKAYEEMISSQKKLNDLVLEGIENLRDEYINNIAKTLEDMDKALWGMNFDDLKEDWDYLQNKADEYLDDVEGAYQIQSLANKIDTSIAETSSLKAQQKLMALREDEINYLREKENLTQDDIDLAEARYQIALKEIALEDAQNNKTSMKLNRDESGNWTYQYVADESDVLSKQQELLDAYNNLYTTADNAYQHAMELSMDTYEEYKEKLTEIAEDITLSEEEKYIKMQELRDTYMPDITAAMENANLYEQETIYATGAVFLEVCDQDKEAYESLTETQKELVDAVKEQHLTDYEEIREAIKNNYDEIGLKAEETFKETNLNSKTAAADVIAQWDGDSDSVKAGLNDAFNSVVEYTQNFEKELRTLEEVSGKTIADAGGVTSDFNSLGKEIDTVGQKTEDMANKATSSLTVLRGFVNEVENAWNGVISKIREATNSFQEYIAVTTGATVSVAGDSSNDGDSSSGSAGGGDGSGDEIGSVGNADIEGIAGNIWTYGEWGDNPTRHAIMRQKFGDAEGDRVFNAVQAKFEAGYGYNGGLEHDYDYYRNYGPSAFYTGGYTGEWGSEGRIGILHEKELVLNANDTQNLLETIRTVQNITGLNNSISSTIADSLAQMVLKSLGFSSKQYETSGNDSTSNVFNITAEFPNADDVQTIREAILSLPNIASQFIHEK